MRRLLLAALPLLTLTGCDTPYDTELRERSHKAEIAAAIYEERARFAVHELDDWKHHGEAGKAEGGGK